jgi:hypothetical protein
MILTHESGSQEDQFDEKNGDKKSRDTIPLKEYSYVCIIISLVTSDMKGAKGGKVLIVRSSKCSNHPNVQ